MDSAVEAAVVRATLLSPQPISEAGVVLDGGGSEQPPVCHSTCPATRHLPYLQSPSLHEHVPRTCQTRRSINALFTCHT